MKQIAHVVSPAAGVYVDKTCWMKYDNTGKVHKAGVVACVTTKTPHPPPKQLPMETHGPYVLCWSIDAYRNSN